MAVQPVFHEELDAGMTSLYARMTRYLDACFDALNGQILADKAEATAREKRRDDAIAILQNTVLRMQRDISSIISFQQTLMDTFKSFAADLLKHMDDGFARQSEQISQ